MKSDDLLSDGRIRLRAPELNDLDFLYALENNQSMWLASANIQPYSRFQLERYIRESVHDMYSDRQIRFVMECEEGHKAVGCIDLTDIDPYNSRAEVGVGVLPEFRGQGYAGAALAILKRYCEKVLHLNQLFCFVDVLNTNSVKLFINSGFAESGILKEWVRGTDSWSDVALMQFFFEKKW